MKLYTANFTQNEKNTTYQNEVDITNIEDLQQAVKYDHLAAKMKYNYRNNDNFLTSDCIMLDLDNTHSEDPEDWKTIKDVIEAFPEVKFYYIQSRNYMKVKMKQAKDGNNIYFAAREKYHFYFPLGKAYESPEEYRAIMDKAAGLFPFFDRGAAKPAQMFFGVPAPEGGEETGEIMLDTFLKSITQDDVKEAVQEFEEKYGTTEPEKPTEGEPITEQAALETDASIDIDIAERNRSLYWLQEWTKGHNIKANGIYDINTKTHPHARCIRVNCPWEHEHSMKGADNETVLIVDAGGRINFLCRHSHGWKYGWKAYRAFYDERDLIPVDPEGKEDPDNAADPENEDARKEKYLQTSAGAQIQRFKEIVQDTAPQIETGFTAIDNILDGGLFSGLYIIGAVSSLGKTTLCLQIADNIASQGKDVLFFSLEMSKAELMAKSISRLTYLYAEDERNAKTARQISNGTWYEKYTETEKALIDDAEEHYSKYARHLFIREGIGNIGIEQIKEAIERHKKYTGNTPVIVIDYVQILAPYNEKYTDKQNTDKNVLELRRISRDYKTPVIGISSFNRESYKNDGGIKKGRVSMTDFKESGALEYSADVLIGLEFQSAGNKDYNERDEKLKNPREINFIVLKNRYGKAFQAASLKYRPHFDYFSCENIMHRSTTQPAFYGMTAK